MNKTKKWLSAVLRKYRGFVAGVVTMLTLGLFINGTGKDSYFEISKNLDIFANLFKELNTYYVDPIEPGELVKSGVDAMLDGLDPYTNYITESDMEEYEFMTTGKYGGIGAVMRQRDRYIFVGDVYENSPAQKAGIYPGDQVLQIDRQPVEGKSIDDISMLLKGSPGTQVVIRVKDIYSGEETDKLVQRGEIELSSVPYAALAGPNKDMGYVLLTQFTPGCSRLVRQSLDSLKNKAGGKLSGVILDLRSNPGGLLDEAVNVCNLFLDKGQLVVSTKGKMQDWDKNYNTPGAAWDNKIPVAVLINGSSASASEIVSGTLQDLDRGVVIGQRSYGKGLVQTTRDLGYNSRLKLTTARYYTPSGRCIQKLDYTHRDASGAVSAIPDSLKKAYKTAGGRKVLSGGGVTPDVVLKDTPISPIAVVLYSKNFLFDYASQFAKTHKTVAAPEQFSMSDADFNAFAQWLEGKDYAYKTSTEKLLDSLESQAKKDKYFEGAQSEFKALKAKVSHDKKQDLMKHKAEVKRLLENEIISRYYYQRGRIALGLQNDQSFEKAMSLLSQQQEYGAILKGK